MRPEQDPVICAQLEAAVLEAAVRSVTAVPSPRNQDAVKGDPGRVPRRVPGRLAGLCRKYGYTVSRADLSVCASPGSALLGATTNQVLSGETTVKLDRGMSPASETRTLAHETAHVILGHAGLTRQQAAFAALKRIAANDEDPVEEAAAELAAAAFCKVARIGTGRFSPEFIWQKFRGAPVPEEAIHAGVLGARILWAAAAPALERRAA